MAYDDLPRVADLKLRAARLARIRGEAGAAAQEPVAVTDYFHPRMAEVSATLPAGLAAWLAARPRLVAPSTASSTAAAASAPTASPASPPSPLVAALGPHRRRLARHAAETEHLDAWFDRALTHAQ
jgi:indolepyruvate ferredoxin oxidoreductase, beta subunit